VRAAQRALGQDAFNVVTIGFDTRSDTPERMRAFARQQGVDLPNWRFLSTDEATLERIAEAVGFSIFTRAGGFDHLAQITIVDAAGRIYQQAYGAVFDPPLVVEPLKDLVLGRARAIASLQDLVDKIKFFCTVYDPGSGRYYFNYSLFIGIAIGTLSFASVLVLLIREWRRAGTLNPGGQSS
jgi:protein SCO1/2